jgi:acyl dehydratase
MVNFWESIAKHLFLCQTRRAEEERGMESKNLFYEDVKVGEKIPPLTKKITLVQMVMYAAATWDFHRHHYDKEFAQQKGFPGPFVDGQMFGAFLAQFITQWTGLNGVLKKMGLNYRMMVFPEDTITCYGKVTEKYVKDEKHFVKCDVWIENQKGEKVVAPAYVLFVLPTKEGGEKLCILRRSF